MQSLLNRKFDRQPVTPAVLKYLSPGEIASWEHWTIKEEKAKFLDTFFKGRTEIHVAPFSYQPLKQPLFDNLWLLYNSKLFSKEELWSYLRHPSDDNEDSLHGPNRFQMDQIWKYENEKKLMNGKIVTNLIKLKRAGYPVTSEFIEATDAAILEDSKEIEKLRLQKQE